MAKNVISRYYSCARLCPDQIVKATYEIVPKTHGIPLVIGIFSQETLAVESSLKDCVMID